MLKYKLNNEAKYILDSIDKVSRSVTIRICNISVVIASLIGVILTIISIVSKSELIGLATLKVLIVDITIILVSGVLYSMNIIKLLHGYRKSRS